jgi:pSer/pThr/pTyr-binding forkhead associated (FHA) protein
MAASSPAPHAASDPGIETAALGIGPPAVHDSIASLDHRSRSIAIRPADAPPGHYLSLESEESDGLLLPVEDRVTHIGRAATADLRFEDPRVSRRHAILVRHGRHVRVLDDRSSEGTFVNGTRIVATDLTDGDVVRLGPVTFTYTIVR